MNIIDVSRYNGKINWVSVAASGKVDGVIIKAVSTNKSFGGLYIDPKFEEFYEGARSVGLPCGAYYYTYATTKAEADKELALFKKACAGKVWELPLVIDVEDNKLTPLSKAALTELVAYACKEIQSWGVYSTFYTYHAYQFSELDMNGKLLKNYDCWYAKYGSEPAAYTNNRAGIWQYTSKAQVPGISGNCDMSVTKKNYPAIIRNAGLTKIK